MTGVGLRSRAFKNLIRSGFGDKNDTLQHFSGRGSLRLISQDNMRDRVDCGNILCNH